MHFGRNLTSKVLAIVMAGGRGTRLRALTETRAKPAVPFGGKYRIIDFILSNIENSGFRHIMVLLQYASFELIHHLQRTWPSDPMHDFYVYPVFPQHIQHMEYQATADAVGQNLGLIRQVGNFETLAILAGDHILAMNFAQMYEYHLENKAHFTIAVIEMPADAVSEFGVLEVDESMRIVGFQEKPKRNPKEIPGKPGFCLVSMGNYFVERVFLQETLAAMAEESSRPLDFGKDVIPYIIAKGADVYAYPFGENSVPNATGQYWRDVGTIKAFHDAHMDLASIEPALNLYNREWVIRTPADKLPPAKLIGVNPSGSGDDRISIVSGGDILQRCRVDNSVFGRNVRVYDGSYVCCSVLFDGVVIGNHSSIVNTVIDEDVTVPPGTSLGADPVLDKARGLCVDESGIVVVPRGFVFR